MWTRSGYTKPFADHGKHGGTDMVYYIVTNTAAETDVLAHNLKLRLFQYIFRSAKWSGFGNEIVFQSLPDLPLDKRLTDDELYAMFGLTPKEIAYVEQQLG
jgi:site-specific DNA-methyltransferase (adenine-specific)